MSAAVAGTPSGEGLKRLRTLVSPYVGLVRTTGEFASAPDDARLVRTGVRLADLAELVGAGADYRAGGSGTSRAAATAAALGEVAERYSASYPRDAGARLATAAQLGARAVAPGRFTLFSAGQYAEPGFPFRPFTGSTPVLWVEGFAVPNGEPVLLPLQLVRLVWGGLAALGEEPIAYATSNGAACACTVDEAVLRGLLEVVERDAFMITWANRLSLPLLDWRRHERIASLDRRYFAPSGLEYAAVDLSIFFDVPTVLGVVRDRGAEGAALGVGAGCSPTVEEAWLRALSEAFSVRTWARLTWSEDGGAADPAAVRSFDDHIRFYATHERALLTCFLDGSPERRDVRDVPALEGTCPRDWIHALAARLEQRGASAYAADITAADVRDAGLHVVKVVVPELCPLDVRHDARFLGGRRLYHAAFELGLLDAPLGPDELNPLPHPFP
jgi:ribosomal protein S12 methylthiotransferase accessory factor